VTTRDSTGSRRGEWGASGEGGRDETLRTLIKVEEENRNGNCGKVLFGFVDIRHTRPKRSQLGTEVWLYKYRNLSLKLVVVTHTFLVVVVEGLEITFRYKDVRTWTLVYRHKDTDINCLISCTLNLDSSELHKNY
jgi:hypothetical protein